MRENCQQAEADSLAKNLDRRPFDIVDELAATCSVTGLPCLREFLDDAVLPFGPERWVWAILSCFLAQRPTGSVVGLGNASKTGSSQLFLG